MAGAGFTPMEMILCRHPRLRQGAAARRSRHIAPGKSAASWVLDANPLDSVANVRKYHAVWLPRGAGRPRRVRAKWGTAVEREGMM